MAMAQHGTPMDTSSQEDSPSLGETLCQMLTSPDKKCEISPELMNALKMNTSPKQTPGGEAAVKRAGQMDVENNAMPPPQVPLNTMNLVRSPMQNAAGKVVMPVRGVSSPQQQRQVAMSTLMVGSPANQQLRGITPLNTAQQNMTNVQGNAANSQVLLQGQQVMDHGQAVWRSPGPRGGRGGQIRFQGRGQIVHQGLPVPGDGNNAMANQGSQIQNQATLQIQQPALTGVARGNVVKTVNRMPMTAQDLAQLGSPGLQQALMGQGQGKVMTGKRVIKQVPLAAVGTTVKGGVSVTKMALAQQTPGANVVTMTPNNMNKAAVQNIIRPALNKTNTLPQQTVVKTAAIPGVRSVVRPATPQQQFKPGQLPAKMAAGLSPNQPRMSSQVQGVSQGNTSVAGMNIPQVTAGQSMTTNATSQLTPEQLLQLQQLQQRHLPQSAATTASSPAGMTPATTTAPPHKGLPQQVVQTRPQQRMLQPRMLPSNQLMRPAGMSPRAMAPSQQGMPQGLMQNTMLRGMNPMQQQQQQQQAALGSLLGNLGQANLSSMTQEELLRQLMDEDDEELEEEEEEEEEEMMDKEEYYLVNDQFYISRAEIDQQAEKEGVDAIKFIETLMRDKVGPGDMQIECTLIPSGTASQLPSSQMSTDSIQISGQPNMNSGPRPATVTMAQQRGATSQPQASQSTSGQQQAVNPLVQQAILQAQKSVGMQPATPPQASQGYTITQKQTTPTGMRLKIRTPAGTQQPRQMIIKANMPSAAQSPMRRGVVAGSPAVVMNTPPMTTTDSTMVNQVGSSDEARQAGNKQSQQSAVNALVQSILNNKQDLDPILSNVLAQLGQTDSNRNQTRTPAQPTNASRVPAATASAVVATPQTASVTPTRAITNVVSATGPVPSASAAASTITEEKPQQVGGNNQEEDKQVQDGSPGASGADNSKYIKGCEYSILYSTGVSVRAIWDGHYFKLKPKNEASSTSSSAAPSVTTQAADSTTPCTTATATVPGAGSSTDAGQVRGGGGGGNKSQQSGPQPSSSKAGQEGGEQNSPGSSGSEDMELELPSNKRPLKVTEAGKFAVCVHCGSMSANYNQCDQCHKTLPDEPRYYFPGKAAKMGESETAPDAEAAARQTLVERVVSQALAKANMGGFNMDKSKFYGNKPGLTYSVRVQGSDHMPRIINRGGRHPRIKVVTKKPARPKRPMEPEMVEISSDEEEDYMDGDAGSGGPSESPGSSRSGTPNVGTGLSRRERMEDEMGYLVSSNQYSFMMHGRVRSPEEDMEDEGEDLSIDEPNCVTLEPRSIRIGSLRLNNFSPVMFRKDGIFFTVEGPSGNTQLHLEPTMITQIMIHPGTRMPVMFIQTTPQAAQVVRDKCNLKTQQPGHPYFDPTSTDETHKMIVILLNALQESKEKLFNILVEGWPQNVEENTMKSKVQEIDFEDANAFLTRSVPTSIVQQLQNPMQAMLGANPMQLIQTTSGIQLVPYSYFNDDCDESGDDASDRSRSPSPPISGFSGSIVKLFTYPPPPATGGITCTNEDLFCLNEGEFLNDVIIDFYLKYLLNEIMSEEDRSRTHIFSSFFYRRLSQRNKGRFGEEDCKMTPQQRRHNRVKTWTRHVDLFAKDFVIVPINESAHWYLAIICFPGMTKPEHYGPNELNGAGDNKSDTSSENGASKSESDPKEESQTTETKGTKEESKSATDSKEENGMDAILKKGGEDVSEEVKQVVEKVIMEKLSVELKGVKNSEEKSDSDKKDGSETPSKDSAKSPADGETEGDEKAAAEKPTDVATPTKAATTPAKPATSKKKPGPGDIKRQPCILIFDSLSGPSRSCVIRTLRDYIAVEWDVKKSAKEGARTFDKDNMRGANPRCPQQTNYSDCGVYLLQYVQSFFEQPITYFNLPMKQLQHWFPDERVRLKRVQLRELILSFQKKLNPKLQYDPTKDIIS